MSPRDLRAAREELGLTQKDLAEKLQINKNVLARWERGELRIAHPEMLRLAIAKLAYDTAQAAHETGSKLGQNPTAGPVPS